MYKYIIEATNFSQVGLYYVHTYIYVIMIFINDIGLHEYEMIIFLIKHHHYKTNQLNIIIIISKLIN
jgi:hypothetical protein